MWKQLLEKLLCKHRWKVHKQTDVALFDEDGELMLGGLPYKIEQVLICEECGAIKKIKL